MTGAKPGGRADTAGLHGKDVIYSVAEETFRVQVYEALGARLRSPEITLHVVRSRERLIDRPG